MCVKVTVFDPSILNRLLTLSTDRRRRCRHCRRCRRRCCCCRRRRRRRNFCK